LPLAHHTLLLGYSQRCTFIFANIIKTFSGAVCKHLAFVDVFLSCRPTPPCRYACPAAQDVGGNGLRETVSSVSIKKAKRRRGRAVLVRRTSRTRPVRDRAAPSVYPYPVKGKNTVARIREVTTPLRPPVDRARHTPPRRPPPPAPVPLEASTLVRPYPHRPDPARPRAARPRRSPLVASPWPRSSRQSTPPAPRSSPPPPGPSPPSEPTSHWYIQQHPSSIDTITCR
jgi:hypothetical protein